MAITLIGTATGPRMDFDCDIPEWTDTLRWRVTGSASAYAAIIALNAANKGYGAPHPDIPGISGKSVQMEQSTAEGYILQVEHRRPPMGVWPTLDNIPIRMGISFGFVQIPADSDYAKNTVVNSAGDPIDPPQTVDMVIIRTRLLKWNTSFDVSSAASMIGKVNSADITFPNSLGAIPARTLKCLNVVPMVDLFIQPGSTSFYSTLIPVLYEFEGKSDTYDRKIIDRGFQGWYDTGSAIKKGKIVIARDLSPIPGPVLLDGQGSPVFTAPYKVKNAKDGFVNWASATTPPSKSARHVPDYITPAQGSDSASGWYLPYRIEPEADFSPFLTAGL